MLFAKSACSLFRYTWYDLSNHVWFLLLLHSSFVSCNLQVFLTTYLIWFLDPPPHSFSRFLVFFSFTCVLHNSITGILCIFFLTFLPYLTLFISFSLVHTCSFFFTGCTTEVVLRVHDRVYQGIFSILLPSSALPFYIIPLSLSFLSLFSRFLPLLVLAFVSFQPLSIFRMTHYRDSSTWTRRTSLGKCSVQMRWANESERYKVEI